MQTQVFVRNPNRPNDPGHFEYITINDSDIQRAVPQPQPVRLPAPSHNNHHPILIAGLVIGLFAGLLACLPASIRGWVVLAILAIVGWNLWNLGHKSQEMAGSIHPVYSDYAPRAELVKLPRK
jgi:hypothetical protein